MPTTNGDLAALAAELHARLDAGALDGLGPVMLTAGLFADAMMAGRILLADLGHLSSLAQHTGSAPAPNRWALLADDVYVLLRGTSQQRNGNTHGQDAASPPAP